MRLGRIQNDYSQEGFDLVKTQKLDFIEICCNFENDAYKLAESKADIKEQIARTGIDVSCVGRWNHDVQSEGRIIAERAESYKALLDAAIEIGAKTFVCGCNYDNSISLYKSHTNAIEFFTSLTEHAKDKNSSIKVAIQNCSWNNFVYEPEQWKVILGENTDLWLKYDASHAYNRNSDYLAQLSDYCERVAHVHIKGTTHAGERKVDDPPAGMDDILWRPLFAILYSRGYNGDLSIEPHSRVWHGELGGAGVEFTRDFIRGFMLN